MKLKLTMKPNCLYKHAPTDRTLIFRKVVEQKIHPLNNDDYNPEIKRHCVKVEEKYGSDYLHKMLRLYSFHDFHTKETFVCHESDLLCMTPLNAHIH